jgi:hypothetical protein
VKHLFTVVVASPVIKYIKISYRLMQTIFKDENSLDTLMKIFKTKIELTEKADLLMTQKIQASYNMSEANGGMDDELNQKAIHIFDSNRTPDGLVSNKFEVEVII